MAIFKYLVATSLFMAVCLTGIGAVPSPLATPLPCVHIPGGDYSIQSVTVFPGVPLGVGSVNTFGNVIVLEGGIPPYGTWRLIPADQNGYHIFNVQLSRNVSTVHLVESNLFLPVVEPLNNPATTYAINCAGGGEYVIKTVNADQVWTPVATADPEVSTIELLPSDGSRTQHWKFVPV